MITYFYKLVSVDSFLFAYFPHTTEGLKKAKLYRKSNQEEFKRARIQTTNFDSDLANNIEVGKIYESVIIKRTEKDIASN